MILNIKKNCIAVGKHKGKLRELAHQVKTGNRAAILTAASLMSILVPQNATLVPIPGHEGDATYTYEIAKEIGRIIGVPVVDAIQGFSRESSHEAKLAGRSIASKVWFYKIEDIPKDSLVVFIDNCVATGKTCEAARHALGDRGYTLAITLA